MQTLNSNPADFSINQFHNPKTWFHAMLSKRSEKNSIKCPYFNCKNKCFVLICRKKFEPLFCLNNDHFSVNHENLVILDTRHVFPIQFNLKLWSRFHLHRKNEHPWIVKNKTLFFKTKQKCDKKSSQIKFFLYFLIFKKEVVVVPAN